MHEIKRKYFSGEASFDGNMKEGIPIVKALLYEIQSMIVNKYDWKETMKELDFKFTTLYQL